MKNSLPIDLKTHGPTTPDINFYTWVKDKNFQFTSCCENVAKLAGEQSPKKLIGKTDFDLIWCDRADAYLEGEKMAMAGRYYKAYELQSTMNGVIKVLVTKCPLLNQKGEIIGTQGTSIDVTDRYFCEKFGYFDDKGKLHLGKDFSNEYLTKREVATLRYILFGYTAIRIAECLHISFKTVQGHIESIKLKLQCQTKGDIIATAVKHGLTYLCEL